MSRISPGVIKSLLHIARSHGHTIAYFEHQPNYIHIVDLSTDTLVYIGTNEREALEYLSNHVFDSIVC